MTIEYLPAERACLRSRLRAPPPWAPAEFRSAYEAARQAVATYHGDDDQEHDDYADIETRSMAQMAQADPALESFGADVTRAMPGDFFGLAIPYDSLSRDMGGWREVIAPGAFDLDQADDVLGLVEHDPARMLGRRGSGTLRLANGRDGLRFVIAGGNTQLLRDTAEQVRRCDLAQCSFGFRVAKADGDSFEKRGNLRLRVVRKAKLTDVSLVSAPAYGATWARIAGPAQQRSRYGDRDRQRQAELIVRRALAIEADEDQERGDRMRMARYTLT